MATQWLEALNFDDKGGWRVETQFVREMGQGYLLGMGLPGVPVADAGTTIRVAAGRHRLWVRTRNWLRDGSPGRFALLVDGQKVGAELGTLPSENWLWQIGGDFVSSGGSHTLSVRDTSGYFPRFAAIIVTDDMDYTPSPEWQWIEAERARLTGTSPLPVDAGTWDVVVAGAGPGGIPAAIAAARAGCRVALVHSRPAIGGNASDEATVGFDGAYIHHPGFREGGIAEELRRERDHYNLTWQAALERLCAREPNLTLFLNRCVVGAETENGRIAAALARDTLTGAQYRYRGAQFIDATGDGWLGYYAGAAYRVGREARWQHEESRAPQNADSRTMSGCLMGAPGLHALSYYAVDTGHPVPFCAPKWAQVLPERLHREPHRWHTGEWWIENPTDYDDLFEAERVRDQLVVISLGYFHWLKNHYEKRDIVANYQITAIPSYNAKRESRRLVGDYILTQDDCTSGRPFADAVAYAGWTIDVHNQLGIYSGPEGPYDFDIRVPLNHVPLRCLYSKNVDNLWMAGRCVSVTHIALGTVRVQNTLATLGQAAGTAAAMAVRQGLAPRAIAHEHIGALQQTLLACDQFIPGLVNEDPLDAAHGAMAQASSVSIEELFSFTRGLPREEMPLNAPYCLLFNRDQMAGALQLYLHNTGGPKEITLRWTAVEGSYDLQVEREAVTVPLAAGFRGFVDIPLSADIQTREVGLMLPVDEAVLVRRVEFSNFGRAYAQREEPYWRLQRNQVFQHRFAGEPEAPLADCSAVQALNGVARPLDAARYAWVSDPAQALPQELTVTFAQPTALSWVQVVFDTDLVNPLYSFQVNPVVPRLVRDYEIVLHRADGSELVAAQVKDNYRRVGRHMVDCPDVTTVSVRVLSTWGDPSARVFELRAYGEKPWFMA